MASNIRPPTIIFYLAHCPATTYRSILILLLNEKYIYQGMETGVN